MKMDSENFTKINLNSTKGSLQKGIEADKLKVEMCQSKIVLLLSEKGANHYCKENILELTRYK
jgi:hypothetical protein